MKTSLTVLAACAIGVLVVVGYWQAHSQPLAQAAATPATQPAAASTTQPAASMLGVEEFMRNVDQHRGPVSVVGIVARATEADRLVVLIDTKEFEDCGRTTCASLALPVRWSGTMPQVSQRVQADGQVQEVAGKLVFVASAVRPLAQASR
jgi:hypothetical protein